MALFSLFDPRLMYLILLPVCALLCAAGAVFLLKVDKENLLQYVSAQDLRAYGLIPEIVGRMPVVTYLHPLSKEAMLDILVKPKNAIIKQYRKLFAMDDVKLEIDRPVLEFIVDTALEYGLGARGLRSICEEIMVEAMYDIPPKGSVKRITIADVEEIKRRKFTRQ